MSTREPWPPSPDEAVALPPEELAMRLLDRLASSPEAKRGDLPTRDHFINSELAAVLSEAKRRLQPTGTLATYSDEALAAFPEFAQALAEAWSYLESRAYLVPRPGAPGQVFISRIGFDRHSAYRGSFSPPVASTGDIAPDPSDQEPPDEEPSAPVITSERPPTAFVSYAHGDGRWTRSQIEEWRTTVLEFTTLLCRMGIDVDLDQFHEHDADIDWNRFGVRAVQDQDYVIIAVSRAYRERWEGRNSPTEGPGAVREADELMGLFNADQQQFRRRVKIVLLPDASADDVPAQLSGLQRFRVDELTEEAAEDLFRTLTGQPATPKPPIGPLRKLPPRAMADHQQRAVEAAEAVGEDAGGMEEIAELKVDLARLDTALAKIPEEVRSQAELGRLSLPWQRAARQLLDQQQAILARLETLESA